MAENRRVIVVGGGPAGLMAAGQAASCGADVVIMEKMPMLGRKLSITGKGRCNLTNILPVEEFIGQFGREGRFLRQAFYRFFTGELLDFFGELGIETVVERGGRIFPASGYAQDVVDGLVQWCQGLGVKFWTEAAVDKLLTADGAIKGVVLANGSTHESGAVILATGGKSYPHTGSTGDGYRMARAVGHEIIKPRPALVPLETAGPTAKRMQGLSLRNVELTLYADGKKQDALFGEMLFTHFGVSGPIILTVSRQVVDAMDAGKKVVLSIDLKPALNADKLDKRLLRDIDANGKQHFQNMLKDLLPRKMIPVCIDEVGIAPDKEAHQITAEERTRLRKWLKDFRLEVVGNRSFGKAIVTAGGVSTKEINPRTMESRVVSGLYFCGEVIDVDAATGGYNLQGSFSTGYVAGQSAAGEGT